MGPADPLGICLHATCALPEAYDVSFRVLEVGCEAHVSNWLLLLDHLAAQLLNVLQRCIDVGNIDRNDGVLDLVVALCHSAVDGSGLLGHPGLIVSGRSDYPWYSIPGYWLISHPKACL